ncbi:MAG: hypothetical protein H6Q62_336 [Firmicutes bacterium]|nr:hypothetical protein [Bacillota bacterium]
MGSLLTGRPVHPRRNQAFRAITDQIRAASDAQGVLDQLEVLRFGKLQQSALHPFLDGIRDMDRLQRQRIKSCMIHGR